MTQYDLFKTSFNMVKTTNDNGRSLLEWTFEINNDLNIIDNDPQIIPIIRTNCGGMFECTDCGHKWTKKSHSTILFQCDKVQRKIECKLFGHMCLHCGNKAIYHTADYNDNEIQDAMRFLRMELLRKLHPRVFGEGGRDRMGVQRRNGPPQQYYNVDFADYCEACRRGDYCRLHSRN